MVAFVHGDVDPHALLRRVDLLLRRVADLLEPPLVLDVRLVPP